MALEMNTSTILVTGGTGFLGTHLTRLLRDTYPNASVYSVGSSVDLREYMRVDSLFSKVKPDYVFHLAGWNGGIAWNNQFPARIFYDNTVMALNVIQACAEYDVKKVLSTVASCAYPEKEYEEGPDTDTFGEHSYHKFDTEVMDEHGFLDGPPHPSVACHGYARRNVQLASKFYHDQYGLNAVCVCPTTLYGPGEKYESQRTKVLNGLIYRFVKAIKDGEQEVVLWGTGKPMREFLYVEDAAKLIHASMHDYDDNEMPLNLGSGQEYSIWGIANGVAAVLGYRGWVGTDPTKPDGQFRKRLDITRMRQELGEFKFTDITEGVRRTADYYRSQM